MSNRPLWRTDPWLWFLIRLDHALRWLRPCPTCGSRPRRAEMTPRWDEDPVAWMFTGSGGPIRCPDCGAEADTLPADYTCPTVCVAANHPGREHDDWLTAPTPPVPSPETDTLEDRHEQ